VSAGAVGHRGTLLRLGSVVAVAGVAALALLALQPGIAGLFHDDGIYVSLARSIAEGDGYRLANLPGSPAETKYPFGFPFVLSLVWRVFPSFPENAVALKAVGVVSLVAVTLLSMAWYARRTGCAEPWQIVFALLVATGPFTLPFVDYTLTELPFMALCLAVLALADYGPGERDDPARHVPGMGTAVALGILTGAAFLMRQAAAPLVLGCIIPFVRHRRHGPLAVFLGVGALFAVPWLLFQWTAGAPGLDPLLAYYTTYEPSIPELVARDGWRHAGLVWANLAYVGKAADAALALPAAPGLRLFVYPLILVGWITGLRRPIGLVHWFSVTYLALILLWPWHPARYSLPLLPLIPLGLVLGTRHAVRAIGGSDLPRAARAILRVVACAPLIAVAGALAGWNAAFLDRSSGSLRLWFAADAEYGWSGFEETIDWIRDNTPENAVIASALDPLYYLYTDRRAVRPWFHRPWTYFYPPGHPAPFLGPPGEVQASLENLGVRYLVRDPLAGYAEATAIEALFAGILAAYSTDAFEGSPILRFVSADSLHRVYELPKRAGDETGSAVTP